MALLHALLTLSLTAAPDIPGIGGHMTDHTHQLSDTDLNSINDKLGKIADDTRIDCAAWIVDAPEAQLEELGNAAYAKWNIGRDWENGVFFMIPKIGRWRVILNKEKPYLTPEEVAKLTAADNPSASVPTRMNALNDSAGAMLRAKALAPRPPGKKDPVSGAWYGLGVAILVIAAVVITIRRARNAPTNAPQDVS